MIQGALLGLPASRATEPENSRGGVASVSDSLSGFYAMFQKLLNFVQGV